MTGLWDGYCAGDWPAPREAARGLAGTTAHIAELLERGELPSCVAGRAATMTFGDLQWQWDGRRWAGPAYINRL